MFSSILTTLTTDFCTIAFQLLAYQEEFFAKFSKNFNDTLTLIKNTNFRSAIVKSKKRQIRVTSDDNNLSAFFSSNWVIDKIILRRIIKQFLLNIKEYQQIFQKSNFHSQSSIFSFTGNKSIQLSLTFLKHVKNNFSNSDDISIVWSIVFDIFQDLTKTTMTEFSSIEHTTEHISEQSILSNLDLISEQMQTLSDTIIATVDTKINRLSNELRQLLQSAVFLQQSSVIIEQRIDVEERSAKDWTAEKVEFFDSTADDFESVINLRKHVFYRDIYAFVNRLKNVSFIRRENKLRVIIFQCFRDIVFIWHSTELFDVEKEIYRDMSVQNWCNVLIKRFKERVSAALNYLQSIKYIFEDARRQKNSRIFVQDLFRHAKTADFISVYNQFILTWNNLNWQFRQHVSQFTKNTIIQFFLKQLDSNCDIWFELVSANREFFNQSKRFINKSYYQNLSKRNTNRFQNNRYFFFKLDIAYQSNSQNRSDHNSNVEINIKIDKNNSKSTIEREFDRNNRNRDDKNKDNKSRDWERKNREKAMIKHEQKYDKNKVKVKAYMTQKNFSNELNNENMNDQDLNYFDSEYDESSNSENIIEINYASLEIACRRCQFSFSSNNLLHKHIRAQICSKNIFIKSVVHNTTIETIKRIIRFRIDLNKNIETEYDFRDWQYVTALIVLNKDEKFESDCLDTGADVTLIDMSYFKNKFKDISIRTMTSLITVRDLETVKHTTDKYVCCLMYFFEKDKDDHSVLVEIVREIHLVDNLKINLLIDNDILESELIDIFTFINTAIIESCDVIVSIVVKFKSSRQTRVIHAIRSQRISSHFKLTISIHKIMISKRDYIFESKEIKNLAVYAHIIDNNIKTILIRNDDDKAMKISRNFRLKDLIEIDFSNVMHVDVKHVDLVIKQFKNLHKSFWLHKALKTYCNNVDTFTDKQNQKKQFIDEKHFNEIIIYRFFIEVVKVFIKIINDYSQLWTDQEFAELSKKNWMHIFLRLDWEFTIKDKTKIYSLKIRDKLILNQIFNKLHEQNRLFWTTKSTSFSFSCFVVWKDSESKKKDRVVVDIRTLNAIFLFDFYSLSLQSEIIQTVHNCTFISTIDCISFFYQWRIHSQNRHKMTIVIHRDQKIFNVAIMRYKNSSVYVQRQIDRILKFCRIFARAYIDDVVIFSKTLNEHLSNLRSIFDLLKRNNIFINSVKTFLKYSFVNLLSQHVNSLDLSTNKKKIKTISNFVFSKTLSDLETYLKLTKWFRDYIKNYVIKFESLQNRKTALLKESPKSEQVRKCFTTKTKFFESTFEELNFFRDIQSHFFKIGFFNHFDSIKQLYADFDTNDKNIETMIYHIKENELFDDYLSRKSIRSILFLSRLLNSVETKYWSIELKLTELVWVLRKIRHMIESILLSTIIYTDHETTLSIFKQISLSTFSTDKLNLRIVKIFEYIQRFELIIRHKFEKLHLIFDVLSRLSNNSISTATNDTE